MKKKILTAALVLSMAVSATGCGSKSEEPVTTPTPAATSSAPVETPAALQESSAPEQTSSAPTQSAEASSDTQEAGTLLEQANQKLAAAKSFESSMNLKMAMAGEENGQKQTMEINTTSNITYFLDPYKMKVDVIVDLGEAGGKQETSTYLMKEKKKYYTYSNVAGTWTKNKMDKALFEQSINNYNADVYFDAYKECINDFTVTSSEENGAKLLTLEGNITGEAMQKMVEASGASKQVQGDVDISSILGNISGIPAKMTINQDTMLPTKMTLDMTEFMASTMSSNPDTQGIEVTETIMDIEYTNIDNATDFELPSEAKDAKEVKAAQ